MKNKKLKKKLLHYKQLFKYNTKTIKAQFDTVLVQKRRIADLKKQNAELQEAYDNAELTIQELQSINAITKERESVKTETNEASEPEISLHNQILNLQSLLANLFDFEGHNDAESSEMYDLLHNALYYAKTNKRPDVQTKRES